MLPSSVIRVAHVVGRGQHPIVSQAATVVRFRFVSSALAWSDIELVLLKLREIQMNPSHGNLTCLCGVFGMNQIGMW